MEKETQKYDYIIAGAGCAGLSLLYSMLKDPDLKTKRILVVDKDAKSENDRTWCYWEKDSGPFESVVHHQWQHLEFLTSDYSRKLDLGPYRYKMIRGIDFYEFIMDFVRPFDNVDFKVETVENIVSLPDKAEVHTGTEVYSAEYVFNSTPLFNPEMSVENSLLQHFEGWVIRTEEPVFDDNVGTLMDFTLDQKHGTTFMYVLPTSPLEALVEYTLFTEKILKREEYGSALREYIRDSLKMDSYEVVHSEFGIIPMSLARFDRSPLKSERVVNIGTAGGFTKASSGYTFQFIQKHTETLIAALSKGDSPNLDPSFGERVYQWYDRTLLDVLISGKMEGKEVFSRIFKNRSPESILAFLGNESSFGQDLQIMTSLPILPFLSSGLKQLATR